MASDFFIIDPFIKFPTMVSPFKYKFCKINGVTCPTNCPTRWVTISSANANQLLNNRELRYIISNMERAAPEHRTHLAESWLREDQERARNPTEGARSRTLELAPEVDSLSRAEQNFRNAYGQIPPEAYPRDGSRNLPRPRDGYLGSCHA